MKSIFAGTADFVVTTTEIQLTLDQQQQEVVFTLEPDIIAQEPFETFQIVVTIDLLHSRNLGPNEFIQGTKTVTIVDATSKRQ